MQAPLCVRPPTDAARRAVGAGRRASQAFTLRRCQIILASARGEHTPAIAAVLGCSAQTVGDAIHAFDRAGVAALTPGSKRPHPRRPACDAAGAERLRDPLHRRPRDCGPPTSLWTLDLAAATAFAEGLTATRITGETVRATPARRDVRWQRAKRWIASPDPASARNKAPATG